MEEKMPKKWQNLSLLQRVPDKRGHFCLPNLALGGMYVPETLMNPLYELEECYEKLKEDKEFQDELSFYLRNYAGRPTPLYFAERLTALFGGAKIYLKREDLAHTGAHKINNTLGQVLLAKKMGKKRIIAETGAGQHGVATATAAALFGMECKIYMGKIDFERQSLNVFRMQTLGAEVEKVESGSQTLKDAINEAIRDWVTNVDTTHYVIGSVVGPHPYPKIVRDFQSVIGKETKEQIMEREKRLPDALVACVGGGSNAMGFFHPFSEDDVLFFGVEAEGAASLCRGSLGVLHGSLSYLLQDEDGLVKDTHSIAAGLDYPGVGPEHSFYKELCRAEYTTVSDEEAVEAFCLLSKEEGILPALEAAHAIFFTKKLAKELGKGKIIIVCLSGRGDKDVELVRKYLQKQTKGEIQDP